MNNLGVPKNGTDRRRRKETLGAEQGLVNIQRLLDWVILQESCPQLPAFKMPLAFST